MALKQEELEEEELDRTIQLKKKVGNSNDADFIMENIIELFTEQEFIPDTGQYYTFIYSPKSPEIVYDQYPLVAVTKIYNWGFGGINYHWREHRQYSWNEVVGQLHLVHPKEIGYLRELYYEKIVNK